MKKLNERFRRTPWFILLSRFCQAAGMALPVLFILHLVHSGGFAYARLESEIRCITDSDYWGDMLLSRLYFYFVLYGSAVAVFRQEMQKKALIGYGVWAVTAAAVAPMGNSLPPLARDLFILLWPAALGVWAACFERIHGRGPREKWLAEHPVTPVPEVIPLSPQQKKKLTVNDFLPLSFLLFIMLCLCLGGINYVRMSRTALWHFAGVGLLVLVSVFYLGSLLRWQIAPSVLMSRFIRGAGAAALMLYGVHLLFYPDRSMALRTANLTDMSYSAWWPDHALLGTLVLIWALSTALTLRRKETRRTVLASLMLWPPALSIAMGLYSHNRSSGVLSVITELVSLAWPVFTALYAMFFERYYGKDATSEWRQGKIRKLQKQAAARQTTVPAGPATVRPAPVTTAGSVHKAPPLQKTPVPPPDPLVLSYQKEIELRARKQAYLNKRQKTLDSRTAASQLPKAAERLFPGNATLATLDGQRQLLAMLTAGVPCLKPLSGHQAAKDLMRPELQDDPAQFIPLLDMLKAEAARLLGADLWSQEESWKALSPEALAGGWYALEMYIRMGADADLFGLAAEGLADYISGRPDAMEWLNSVCNE